MGAAFLISVNPTAAAPESVDNDLVQAPTSKGKGNPSTNYGTQRQLAWQYLGAGQFAKAVPLFKQLVAYCSDSKHYYDLGAQWDQRRRQGIPTEKFSTLGGEPVTILDNRRPVGKLGKADLLQNLIILAELESRTGDKASAKHLDQAKNTYLELFAKSKAEEANIKSFSDYRAELCHRLFKN